MASKAKKQTAQQPYKRIRVKRGGKQMSDLELRSVLQSAYSMGCSFNLEGEVADERARSLRYYRGEPFGNERAGRSRVVSRDVMDTVETILPELVETFVGGDDVVEFEPTTKDQEEQAKLATAYGNYVFNRDNNGFMITLTMFKDALVQKNGIVKVMWEEKEEKRKMRLRDISTLELHALMEDDNVEIEEQAAYTIRPDVISGEPQEVMLDDDQLEAMDEDMLISMVRWDLKICRYYREGRNVIDNVPPEEFCISPRAKRLCPAPDFCFQRTEKTASELLQDYPEHKKKIDAIGGWSMLEWGTEQNIRYEEEGFSNQTVVDEAMRKMLLVEFYIHVDYDGDGIAELRKIVTAGANIDAILENEEIADHPFASITPIPEPHKFHGMSYADIVRDIQEIKSTITRQLLDNMYQANNMRTWAIPSKVNMNDLLDSRPNSIVRVKEPGSFGEIKPGSLPGEGLSMVEHFDSVREQRTGVYRQSRGMDVDRLHDTAKGIQKLMDKQDKRTMLVARIFADTGMTRIFSLIHKNSVAYMDKPRMIKIADNWVDVDPRTWDADMRLDIKVGLGTGNKEETIGRLTRVLASVREFASSVPGTVPPDRAYNLFADYLKAEGIKTPDRYLVNPSSPEYKPPQPQPSERVQVEQIRAQQDKYETDKELALDYWKAEKELEQADRVFSYNMALGAEAKKTMPSVKFGGSPAQ